MIPEIKQYIDSQGMFAQVKNPTTIWTGGNQLLETWTAWILLKKAGKLEVQDMVDIIVMTNACEAGVDGMYDKNPPGPNGRRLDDITRDDLLAISMGSSILHCGFEEDIVEYAELYGWKQSNNGKWYWTAACKPWDRAAYLLAANRKPDDWSLASLFVYILFSAFFRPDDAGGKRLVWLIIEAIGDKHPLMAFAGRIWHWRIGSMKKVFEKYHGLNHPFTMLAPE